MIARISWNEERQMCIATTGTELTMMQCFSGPLQACILYELTKHTFVHEQYNNHLDKALTAGAL